MNSNNVKSATLDSPVAFFSEDIRKRLGKHIEKVILYGSRARGDFNEGSDYDFLVLVDKKQPEMWEAVLDSGTEFLNRYDILASCLLWDRAEWDQKKRIPIGINVQQDGLDV